MFEAATFWTKRLVLNGHTGWSDPVIYAYDQQERLHLLRSVIPQAADQSSAALDLGCGTGDFSRLLLEKGFTVSAYDPFVKPAIDSPRFSYAAHPRDLRLPDCSAVCALSVTTLDHIVANAEIRETLHLIAEKLLPGGTFFMLEYALNSDADLKTFGFQRAHQAFRTVAEWGELLEEQSLEICEIRPAPHPLFNPSAGYQHYAQGWVVNLRRQCRSGPLARLCDQVLRRRACRLLQRFGTAFAAETTSPLKFIRCRKAA